MNKSFQRLQDFDFEEHEDVDGSVARWFIAVKKELNCKQNYELKAEKFMGPTKKVLSYWLAEAQELMARQSTVIGNMQEAIELMKTEALSDKDKVIRLQEELLEHKDGQLKTLQTAVQETVQETVQSQIESFSDIVKKNREVGSGSSCSVEKIKHVMKSVVEEEDRSKNLIVYGLAEEEEGEQLPTLVSELLGELDEKPHFEATRVGLKKPGSTTRPIKITLRTSTARHQILLKTSRLRRVEKRKDVYICPDRSREERAAQKLLVTDLKRLNEENPGRKHFIRGGKVCSHVSAAANLRNQVSGLIELLFLCRLRSWAILIYYYLYLI